MAYIKRIFVQLGTTADAIFIRLFRKPCVPMRVTGRYWQSCFSSISLYEAFKKNERANKSETVIYRQAKFNYIFMTSNYFEIRLVLNKIVVAIQRTKTDKFNNNKLHQYE